MVLWSPGFISQPGGVYTIRSSAPPTTWPVNLVRHMDAHCARGARDVVRPVSGDRAVVGLASIASKEEEGLAGYQEAMKCHLGGRPSRSRPSSSTLRSRKATSPRDGVPTSRGRPRRSEAGRRDHPSGWSSRRALRVGVVVETTGEVAFDNARPGRGPASEEVVRPTSWIRLPRSTIWLSPRDSARGTPRPSGCWPDVFGTWRPREARSAVPPRALWTTSWPLFERATRSSLPSLPRPRRTRPLVRALVSPHP